MSAVSATSRLIIASILCASLAYERLDAQIPEPGPALLKAGDMVRIDVWQMGEEFSGEFEVGGDGTIAHPLYRQIRVADRDIGAVETDLRALLRHYVEEPSFVVAPLVRISVGGEVLQPDVYTLRPETSIARALVLAGGPSLRGALERVTLRREGRTYALDLTDPTSSLRDLEVRSGDEIMVERRRDVFRELIAPSASIVAAIAAVLRLII